MSNRSARSVTRAGADASCSSISRREEWEIAPYTRSRSMPGCSTIRLSVAALLLAARLHSLLQSAEHGVEGLEDLAAHHRADDRRQEAARLEALRDPAAGATRADRGADRHL